MQAFTKTFNQIRLKARNATLRKLKPHIPAHSQGKRPRGPHKNGRHRTPLLHMQVTKGRHNYNEIYIWPALKRQASLSIQTRPHRRMPAVRTAGLVYPHCRIMQISQQPIHLQTQRIMPTHTRNHKNHIQRRGHHLLTT